MILCDPASPRLRFDMPCFSAPKTIVLFGIILSLSPSLMAQNAKKLAFFENHIRPLLSEHCFECHNAEKQEGGLRLDVQSAMLLGGDSGPAIVPGKPEESLLIEAIRYEGLEMPPEEPLPADQVAKLIRWTREGAVWPSDQQAAVPSLGDQNAIRTMADSHWAFQAIRSTKLPPTSDPDWAKHPIDKYVLAKLESNGLTHSPPATRNQLIRRAFHELLGLPPTPQIIQSVFGKSSLSGINYKEIVVGLLNSNHYGERMARHWMDIARYADTRDFLAAADLRYPFAFTYRDWLIDAFNDDLPFDDFVRKQLAADLIVQRDNDPDLAALGFLTVGPLFRNNQLERIADRVDVVTRGLMGLTGSCARCHDHKYDPLSIEDYYSLYGVFRDSVQPSELPVIENPLGHTVDADLLKDFEVKLAAEKEKLAQYEAKLAVDAMADFQKDPANYLAGYYELRITNKQTARGLLSKRKLKETAITPIANQLDVFRKDRENESHFLLGPLVSLIAAKNPDFAKRKKVYLGKYGEKLHPQIKEAVNRSETALELVKNIGDVLSESLDESNSELVAVKEWFVEPTNGPFHITPKAASNGSRLLGAGRQKLLRFQEAIADVEATHPGAPDKAMTLEDAKQSRPVFVMFRGDPARRGPSVAKQFPAYFSDRLDGGKFSNGSGRFELAEKIVDPRNPLTARVIVNRIWRMHFGRGLVADAGDFGLRSENPMQLDLLNYLSAALIRNGWSIKWLHQTIMLSNTYRQSSSAVNPPKRDDGTSATEIDSENQLLWRQNRRRLDFESMRDAMLAVAGTLDTSVGGRSVKLSDMPHPTRRSVYAYVDRVEPDPIFATFDVPSADVSSAQRTETLVPQQALFTMNNPFVTDQARAMVASLEFQESTTDAERVEVLIGKAFQRASRPKEIAMIRRYVDQADRGSADRASVWEYGYGSKDEFNSFSYFDGSRYATDAERPSPETGFAMLTRSGGHPGKDSSQCVIRRWTAPEDMLIRIAGVLDRKSDRGDGINATILVAGESVFELKLPTGQKKSIAGYHRVKAGQKVEFVVDPLETSTSDGFRWTVVIEQRDESKETVLYQWKSANDFAGPLPPPLDPWEQTAQALLLTNEFLFVD